MSDEHAPPGLRGIVAWSLVAGVCPLSPIPFIDDLVIGWMRRRMLRRLFTEAGVELAREQLRALTRHKRGCLRGCLFAVFLYPIKRIFRKIIYILAVKACVDTTSQLMHEGILVRYAIAAGRVESEALAAGDTASLERVNAAVVLATKETDTSPVTQVLKRFWRGSKVLVKEAGRTAMRLFRKLRVVRNPDSASQVQDAVLSNERINALVDELLVQLWAEEGYLPDLYARFDRAWEEFPEPGTSGASGPEPRAEGEGTARPGLGVRQDRAEEDL